MAKVINDNPSITIEVVADNNNKLYQPIKVGETIIKELGIYQVGVLRICVVKELHKFPSLPMTCLPRFSDDRENIKELCVAVNKIVAYLEWMKTRVVEVED
jgi:hypothetical protein